MNELQLPWVKPIPPGIEGRGRNGFFKLTHIGVFVGSYRSQIAFYSSRIGNSPPMMLTSDNPENLRAALQQVLKKLDEITDHPAKKTPDPASLIQAAQISSTKEAWDVCQEVSDAAD